MAWHLGQKSRKGRGPNTPPPPPQKKKKMKKKNRGGSTPQHPEPPAVLPQGRPEEKEKRGEGRGEHKKSRKNYTDQHAEDVNNMDKFELVLFPGKCRALSSCADVARQIRIPPNLAALLRNPWRKYSVEKAPFRFDRPKSPNPGS